MTFFDKIKNSQDQYIKNKKWPFHVDQINSCIFLNHYSISLMKENSLNINEYDYVFLDGLLLVKQLSRKFKTKFDRVSFDMSSVAQPWFESAVSVCANIIIAGGSLEEMKKFEKWWRTKIFKNNVYEGIHFINGYSKDLDIKICEAISNDKFNFIVLGLGTPLQEITALNITKKLNEKNNRGIALTCGGFITQTAKSIDGDGFFYPDWINKLNLRWLYRCYKQPFVIKRLIVNYPKSFIDVEFNKLY